MTGPEQKYLFSLLASGIRTSGVLRLSCYQSNQINLISKFFWLSQIVVAKIQDVDEILR